MKKIDMKWLHSLQPWTFCRATALPRRDPGLPFRQRTTAWVLGLALFLFPAVPGIGQASSAPQAPASPQPGASNANGSKQTGGAAATPAKGTQPNSQTAQPVKPGSTDDSQYTISTNVNEVNLIFTVTDRHGRFIENLQQRDFALLDDQKAPAQVFSFTQQTNLPLRVGILIDASTSIRQRFEFEQGAAIQFLQQVVRPKTDLAFVMGFDVTPYVTQGYTNDQDRLEAGITTLRPGGGTALFDAVYVACRDHLLRAPNATPGAVRKALVVISDGDDNQSRAYPDDAIKMCQRAETIVYTISTNVSPSRDRGDEVLKQIAEATGGVAFFPHRLEDMSQSFRNIEDELRSQYSLAYRPADFKLDGSFRSIYLVALDRRYVVRASKGYFASRF
jgi:Ca-activated chloride channel homolog